MFRIVERCRRALHSGNASAMFWSAMRRWLCAKCQARWPRRTPMARPTGSGRIRPHVATIRSGMKSSRDLNALRFGFSTLEFLDDGVPVAALAQQPLNRLPKCAFAAASVELPRRRFTHFGGGIRRRRGDAGPEHRREIGKVVAEVEELIEAEAEFLDQAFARFQFVCGTLMQF